MQEKFVPNPCGKEETATGSQRGYEDLTEEPGLGRWTELFPREGEGVSFPREGESYNPRKA